MENNSEPFTYEYSAKRQEEIQKIREKYLTKTEDKLELLQKLDRAVVGKATITALVVGIIGALVMGFGMSCCLVWGDKLFLLGIFAGIAGMIGMAFAYPVYNKTLKKEREKAAPEILRLSEELQK